MKSIGAKSYFLKGAVAGILFFFIRYQGYSQESLPTANDYKKFYKTKTLIVLEDSPFSDYNSKIKNAIQKNWKLTEYDFISNKEFEQKKLNPEYSFLVTSIVTFNKDKTKAEYNFLSLLMGGTATDITDMTDLCSIPLSYLDVDEESYLYKMESLTRFIQNHVSFISDYPSVISKNILKFYNKNMGEIKNKILYITQKDLPKDAKSLSKIKKLYSGRVKIVSSDEIENAISNKDRDVVFLHKVGPEKTTKKARCFKVIIGADDAKIYYFDYHMIKNKQTDSFLSKDFKKLLN
ncbi:hypothetical protein GCQ56_15705 [Marinifilum sp. N1E240]|uniref:hypothetical protein n=1 Tax=Marinifilum sp. N1E240 TaxID=2608082 RepID=UPI00128DA71F|nr:hypothetical protein [Marinifilum sp. N1E240]MPQ48450.1 hypothetical protein [Marinifilum sp. N1E240]